jgi:hypothetical protein
MLPGTPTILDVVSAIDTHRISWIVRGNTYEDIEWGDDDTIPRPSKERVETKLQELIDAQPLENLRQERNGRIGRTDFLMVSDFPFPSDTIRQAWKTYRQALRDITATTSRDLNEDGQLAVTWPIPPIWPANVV